MAVLTIRNIEDAVKSRLRIRAARHGRSMEDEVRQILRAAVADQSGGTSNLADRIHTRFAALGGVDLELPPREPAREPAIPDD